MSRIRVSRVPKIPKVLKVKESRELEGIRGRRVSRTARGSSLVLIIVRGNTCKHYNALLNQFLIFLLAICDLTMLSLTNIRHHYPNYYLSSVLHEPSCRVSLFPDFAFNQLSRFVTSKIWNRSEQKSDFLKHDSHLQVN